MESMVAALHYLSGPTDSVFRKWMEDPATTPGSSATMALNIDNALSDALDRLPHLVRGAASARRKNTPENEPRWIVNFKGIYDEILDVEVIVRDNAIVMSVLNSTYEGRETAKIMGVFMELLSIVP